MSTPIDNVRCGRWVSISEGLPPIAYENKKSATRVLAWDGVAIKEIRFRHLATGGGIFYHAYVSDILENITHWMELPEPPNE